MQPQLPVSLVVITLNEEKNIARAIRSAPFVSQIIVLDSGSTDRTCEIAKSLGAQVFTEKFRGFREQKARAVQLADQDWILSLDADEAVSPELAQEIQTAWAAGHPSCAGFDMSRLSFYLGRWIRHGGWFPDRQLRLFNRKQAAWTGGHVHERVTASGEVIRFDHPLHHFVFRDLAHQVATNNYYSTQGALDLQTRGKRFGILPLIFKPVSKFFETYILKCGFRDGLPGFLISVSASYSMFLKYAKLWELKQGTPS